MKTFVNDFDTVPAAADGFTAAEDQKLIELGKRQIRRRIEERQLSERRRAIVQCVERHVYASAGELRERLTEIMELKFSEATDQQIRYELAKLSI